MRAKPLPPLTEDEKAEAERHRPLVIFMVKTFGRTKIPRNDQYSIGMFGLVKAIREYNPNRKVKFSAYAGQYILNEIRHAEANYDLVRIPVHVQGKDKPDPPSTYTFGHAPQSKKFAASEDHGDDDKPNDVTDALWTLDDLEYEVITRAVIGGWKHRDIADHLNVGYYQVRDIKEKAFKKLAEALSHLDPANHSPSGSPPRTNLAP